MESTTYTVNGQQFELQHHGVKGMKWGVRRAKKSSGGLTDRQIKKYAKKGHAQDSFKSNKTVGGKIWDAYTGAHKIHGAAKYEASSKKQNRERAEKYLADKERDKKAPTKQKVAKAAAKGALASTKVLAKVGQAYVTDQLFFGGMGTKAVKKTIQAMGIVTISGWKAAHGATDIHWYDKQGRKIV